MWEYLPNERWFMDKDRALAFAESRGHWQWQAPQGMAGVELIGCHFERGQSSLYQVPWRGSDVAALAHGLGALLVEGRSVRNASGRIVARRWNPLGELPPPVQSDSGREQSNSSVLFPGRWFVKLYRRLLPGIHPEAEMGIALREQGYEGVPQVLGTWSLQWQGREYALGIAQEACDSAVSAWDQIGKATDSGWAYRLGAALANLHKASARVRKKAFLVESDDARAVKDEGSVFQRDCLATQQMLIRIVDGLSGLERAQTLQLLAKMDQLPALWWQLRQRGMGGQRIRIHGDLHLGQVLDCGETFRFIDFEGEPAVALSRRRRRYTPLKDMAGLLRSFAYAEAMRPACPAGLGDACWAGYQDAWGDNDILPRSFVARTHLLESQVLTKALYEVAYEAANRPLWLHVPVAGLLGIMAKHGL